MTKEIFRIFDRQMFDASVAPYEVAPLAILKCSKDKAIHIARLLVENSYARVGFYILDGNFEFVTSV